jgi:hypothetical protein
LMTTTTLTTSTDLFHDSLNMKRQNYILLLWCAVLSTSHEKHQIEKFTFSLFLFCWLFIPLHLICVNFFSKKFPCRTLATTTVRYTKRKL